MRKPPDKRNPVPLAGGHRAPQMVVHWHPDSEESNPSLHWLQAARLINRHGLPYSRARLIAELHYGGCAA
jgi:hypothetical protein